MRALGFFFGTKHDDIIDTLRVAYSLQLKHPLRNHDHIMNSLLDEGPDRQAMILDLGYQGYLIYPPCPQDRRESGDTAVDPFADLDAVDGDQGAQASKAGI